MSEYSERYKELIDKLGPVIVTHFAGLTPKWLVPRLVQIEEQSRKALAMGLTYDEFVTCFQAIQGQGISLSEMVTMAAQAKSKGPVTHDELRGIGHE